MKTLLLAGFGLITAFSAYSEDVPPTQAIKNLRPLNDVEIKARFSNVSAGPECCDMAEEFYAGGGYMYMGYVGVAGRYSVRSGMVCVTRSDTRSEKCRRLFSDSKGNTYTAKNPKDVVAYYSPIRPLKRNNH